MIHFNVLQMSLEHKHLPICQKDRAICRIVDIYANGDVLNEEEMHMKVRAAFERINECGAQERNKYNLNSIKRQTRNWCRYGIEPDGPPSNLEEEMKKQQKRKEKREEAKRKKAVGTNGAWVSWDDLDAELEGITKINEDVYGSRWNEKLKEWREMLDGAQQEEGNKDNDDCIVID